jgi:hypothetical protein
MQRFAGVLIVADGRVARDGFNAAHAGRNAAFVDDLAEADIAGAAHVGSAAQLLAEIGDVDDAHLIAVLFAEQRHGACADGFIERHHFGFHLGIAEDLLVDEPLHLVDFGFVERRIVGEVEAKPRRLDYASSLLHVRAEHPAKRGVEQMGGGVIAHGGEA